MSIGLLVICLLKYLSRKNLIIHTFMENMEIFFKAILILNKNEGGVEL